MTVTRFAPSPTGYLHVGNLRTALMNWLLARKSGGTFLLRLDDTDPERSTTEFAEAIEEDLGWLGLSWDDKLRQSDRLDAYATAADRLRAAGRLYDCFETPEELELKRRTQLAAGRPPVYDRSALSLTEEEKASLREVRQAHWRFLLDHERIVWRDGILGEVSVDAASVSDPVLIRGDGQVLYTLASVVDDHDLEVTDVVRGSDHVTNTATQIQIFEALGGTRPRFAHHSLLTGTGGESLSKRLGTLSLRDLRATGQEPMAILSLLARLGSSAPIELKANLAEIVEGFEISNFGSAPTRFNPDDLTALTARHLRGLSFQEVQDDLARLGIAADVARSFWEAISGNIFRRAEIAEWWEICQGHFDPLIDAEDRAFVDMALSMLPPRPWSESTWAEWTASVRVETGRKGRALYMPLRQALTGRTSGPDMARFMPLLQDLPAAKAKI
jgi:glutamyl-tRNA synthetase